MQINTVELESMHAERAVQMHKAKLHHTEVKLLTLINNNAKLLERLTEIDVEHIRLQKVADDRLHDLQQRFVAEHCRRREESLSAELLIGSLQYQLALVERIGLCTSCEHSARQSAVINIRSYIANLVERALAEAAKSCIDIPDRLSVVDSMCSRPETVIFFPGRQFTLRHLVTQLYHGIVAVLLGWQGYDGLPSIDHNLLALCFHWLRIFKRHRIRISITQNGRQ